MIATQMLELERKLDKGEGLSNSELLQLRNWYFQLHQYFSKTRKFGIGGHFAQNYEMMNYCAIARGLDRPENTWKDPEV